MSDVCRVRTFVVCFLKGLSFEHLPHPAGWGGREAVGGGRHVRDSGHIEFCIAKHIDLMSGFASE